MTLPRDVTVIDQGKRMLKVIPTGICRLSHMQTMLMRPLMFRLSQVANSAGINAATITCTSCCTWLAVAQ